MKDVNAYILIIGICLLIIFSYLFNLLSRKTGIPSVLLLLISGIIAREVMLFNDIPVEISPRLVEIFGILGLIMIILEAGLDLKIGKRKLKLIRNAFFSAIVILILSAFTCSALLYFYLNEPFINCLIYAMPLSVVSSAIVIPSISHLHVTKKEFLVYETSFSDILGIIIFNYLIAGNILKGAAIGLFLGSLLLSLLLSMVLSFFILFLLTRITTRVRFYLIFSILIFLYAGGKMLHLPALFIILLFGLIVSNWEETIFKRFYKWVSPSQVNDVSHLLHSLTAESSFLIRTFFFFIFGFTINLKLLLDTEVMLAGSSIVAILLGIRYIYLRFFLHSHIFPELFFMPRGLITVLLFYSIPEAYKLSKFNEGILFFVILTTSIIMMIGSIAYGKPKLETINDEAPITAEDTEENVVSGMT